MWKYYVITEAEYDYRVSNSFMNCESTSGCLLGFMIYTGAATNYGTGNTLNLLKDFDSYKSPSNVVLHFLEKCIRPGDSDTR